MSTVKAEPFSFIDLFAGIGGTRLGFESAGGRCVFTSEWDRFARKTYEENFRDDPTHVFASDIREVEAPWNVPDHDVLLAGFPCQPFSLAGVSKKNSLGREHGFLDKTQGTLFFDIARILKFNRPRAFMLENVKNLLGHDSGRTFEVIRSVLEDDLGYVVSHQVLMLGTGSRSIGRESSSSGSIPARRSAGHHSTSTESTCRQLLQT